MRNVVITGIGAVTPLGLSFAETWKKILAGASGIRPISRFDTTELPAGIAGEINDFDPRAHLSGKEINRTDPFIHFAVAAGRMARDDAGLKRSEQNDPSRTAVILGTARGGIATIEENVRRLAAGKRASAYSMPASTAYMGAAWICRSLGLKGPSLGISTACSSGAHAIVEAVRRIRSGEADVALAGGAEAPITPLCLAGYGAARALSTERNDPEGALRPFSRRRDGFVLSEGAAVLVLESRAHAVRRGARVIGGIAGVGVSTDACDDTRPDPDGAVSAIRTALRDGNTGPEDVSAVSTHGTGTPVGDRSEAEALRRVFDERVRDLPVYALKSLTGHLLGASGALEAAVAVHALGKGVLPPTRNVAPPDETLGMHGFSEARRVMPLKRILCNSFGFGGGNAAIILDAVE